MRAEGEKFVTRGVGVSKEAQDVFDSLNKTMQCRWQGKTIIVVDAGVAVEDPYTPESCKSLHSAAQGAAAVLAGERALGRVKKVVSTCTSSLVDQPCLGFDGWMAN